MRMAHFTAFIIALTLWFSSPAMAQNLDCNSACLARGGMPQHCTQQCKPNSAQKVADELKKGLHNAGSQKAIETHGSFGTTPPPATVQPQGQGNNILMQMIGQAAQGNTEGATAIADALYECVETSCKTGLSGLSIDKCIENCRAVAELEGGAIDMFEAPTDRNAAPMMIVPAETGNTASGGPVSATGEGESVFGAVDFECFKQCRVKGDNFETCKTVCKKQ